MNKDEKIEAVFQVFGRHPDDVLSPLEEVQSVLHWLDEAFRSIEQLANEPRPIDVARIRSLARMGRYLSEDFANLFDLQYEEMKKEFEAVEA